ncbi:ABC transporter permease [Nitrosococcus watsonii]|uniref:Binding-protein-dependent transport systems inner membrane component n=1 Tax=Nitrosococcus watsoni (strain C-113) TaxID=105559 RepID=D8K9J7_NITWC|nr:ABC transporter permease [Nitrosococcus watsonii]ADJ27286.1 binding-protein-dependent transport systems inner membrane component [Nitrosococcus watsonii C-113]
MSSPASSLPPPRQSQNYTAQVARQVLAQWGARLGLAWIGLLGLLAVFAPFLASSHPLLLSQDGQLDSPLLRYLTPADASLLALFCAGLILVMARASLRTWLVGLGSVLILAGVTSAALIRPPVLAIYEQYRQQEAAGGYDWVIYAPIPYSPKDYQRDRGETGLQPPLTSPQADHWFGTEENGADVLSRMVHASRIALGIGFVATSIALLLGILIGGLMGYFSGVMDIIGMRLVEIFEAVPTLFLLLTFVAFFERSLYLLMVIIGLTSWSGYARYVRAEFLRLRQQDFVQAALACGLPLRSILFRHMLPNGIGPILVAASFGVASAILAEAVLSFLGLGLVDDPSWGQMLNQAVKSSTFNWWMAAFPGGAIFLTVFAYNLIGEALRDALDPYLKKS